jgi:hypothetical protein
MYLRTMLVLVSAKQHGTTHARLSLKTGPIFANSAVELFTMLALIMTSFAGQLILGWNLPTRRAVVVIVVDIGIWGIA